MSVILLKPFTQCLGPQRSFGRAPDVDQSQIGVKGKVVLRYLFPLWHVVDRTCMVTFGHPCRVKYFRKAVSAVMDDLGNVLAKKIIDITLALK